MALTFSVRSDQLNARYSSAGKAPAVFQNYAPGNPPRLVTASQTGLIGPSYINLNYNEGGGGNRALYYPGGSNVGSNRTLSVLFRASFQDNSALQAVWGFNFHATSNLDPSMMYMFLVSGQIRIAIYDEYSTALLDNFVIGSWTPTVGQYYDILLTSTGDTTTNGVSVYVDGTLIGSTTLPTSVQHPRNNLLVHKISLGIIASDVAASYAYLNEFVVWDAVADPVTLGLTGQSRTSFVACAAFDGLSSIGAGAGNIRLGTTETINGVVTTGTLQQPSPADIRFGVGDGELVVPAEEDVREGVGFDGGSGSLAVPDAADVREGVSVDDTVGTLVPVQESLTMALSSDTLTMTVED